MTAPDLRIHESNTTTVPRGRTAGLWLKLSAELSRSAAGSGLAGSIGSGQPISLVDLGGRFDMFAYDATLAVATDGSVPF